MHENLTNLTRELRKETCPPRVFEHVRKRAAALAPAPKRFRLAISGVTAVLALWCGLVIWRWQGERTAGSQRQSRAAVARERAQLALQTAAALEFVGATLVEAGQRSENAILTQAVPPLRNSLETASKKTINRLKL
jgi:hypothetical protein